MQVEGGIERGRPFVFSPFFGRGDLPLWKIYLLIFFKLVKIKTMTADIVDKNKKTSKYLLAVAIAIILLVLGGVLYYIHYLSNMAEQEINNTAKTEIKPTERDINKILESLTAPSTSSESVPQKILDSATAPKEEKPLEDVLKSLTAPE